MTTTRTLSDGSTIEYGPDHARTWTQPDGPPVRVHLTAATLDAAAAVCEVRGLPHLVARLDRAANEIRSQEDMEADA